VVKYDSAGNLIWTRQLRSARDDYCEGIAADGLGNAYVIGFTFGNLGGANLGVYDAYIVKYDPTGNVLWTRQLGTSSGNGISSVSADGLGNVYISGATGGNLGSPNAGFDDAFIGKYDASGNLLWTR
jgi:hypothetical protein